MSANELLSSENKGRIKELALDLFSAESILEDLVSKDPIKSRRRDAALVLFHSACQNSPATETTAFIDALAKTLTPPNGLEGIDAHGWGTCAEAALAALHSLDVEEDQINDDLLLSLIPYIEAGQPWTTDAAASTATSLIDRHLLGDRKQDFITRVVLQRYLRPIFSKGTSAVTAEGRPALFREPPPPNQGFHEQKAAWKDAGPHVVTVFAWAVEASELSTVKQHWPLYIPVLVTLAEDGDVGVRQRGLDVLDRFLAACPAEVLRASGIDAVFEASVLPTLLFLPSLTPEAESVPLLRTAYRVLRALALAGGADPADPKRRALLDKTLREGVFAGYLHASQHVRVVEVLMQAAAQVVNALEVYAVKHVQSLLDLFTPVLTDAFALAYPPAVIAGAEALNNTIINCWPRIVGTPHAEHIISIVSRCWINVHGSDSSDRSLKLETLADELRKSTKLVASLWRESDEAMPVEKLRQIVQKAPELKPLFAPFKLEESTA